MVPLITAPMSGARNRGSLPNTLRFCTPPLLVPAVVDSPIQEEPPLRDGFGGSARGIVTQVRDCGSPSLLSSHNFESFS